MVYRRHRGLDLSVIGLGAYALAGAYGLDAVRARLRDAIPQAP